jgi:hypothetical protein
VAEFLAAFAKLGEPFAYVDKNQAIIYLEVARPSPCLRAPAGRDWPRDLPCTRPRALRSHSSQMQAYEGDVGEAVEAFKSDHDENLRWYENQAREVRAQAPPCRAGRACWCLASFLHAYIHISTCMPERMRACNFMRALAEPSRAPRSKQPRVTSSARLSLRNRDNRAFERVRAAPGPQRGPPGAPSGSACMAAEPSTAGMHACVAAEP